MGFKIKVTIAFIMTEFKGYFSYFIGSMKNIMT